MYQRRKSLAMKSSKPLAALLLAAAVAVPAARADLAAAGGRFQPREPGLQLPAAPPLPPASQFPAQLVLDDDESEGDFGVGSPTARQFLWFNRFARPAGTGDLLLEEIWVLFTPGSNMAVGNAIELVVYRDENGDPSDGAELLASWNETIQVLDGLTFSVYTPPLPILVPGPGDVLVGVVPRFISARTSTTFPAAIDTTASQGRSWVALWNADPPQPPALPGDVATQLIDGFVPGNWMIRAFGHPLGESAVGIPAAGPAGLALLALLVAAGALVLLRRRAAVLGLVLVVMGAGAVEAQTVIDSFTTNQAPLSDPPGGASSVATGGGDILGTRRDLAVDLLAGAGPVTAGVAGGVLSFAVTDTTPDSRGEALLTWDGDADPNVLAPTGLGGVNLTSGGATGLRLMVNAASAKTEILIEIYSDAGDSSTAGRVLPAIAAPTPVIVGFGEFGPHRGAGADLTDVGAIVLRVRGREASLTLDSFETVSPAFTAVKVDALEVDNDGDTRADPGDRVRYTVTLSNGGGPRAGVDFTDAIDPQTTLVPGTFKATPVVFNDRYTATGNVPLTITDPAAGVLANDHDDVDGTGDGPVTVNVGASDAASEQGGSLALAADGTFTYGPPPGFTGVDAFDYVVEDADGNQVPATAVILVENTVWFVDDSNTTAPFLGTLADPFPNLSQLNGAGGAGDVDGPGDILFVFNDDGPHYTAGLELEDGQRLLGEGVGLTIGGDVIVPANPANAPDLANPAGHVLILADDNTVAGVRLNPAAGAGIFATGMGGTTAVSDVAIATSGTGEGVFLMNQGGGFTFSGNTSITGNGGGAAVRLSGGTATFDFSGTTVAKTGGRLLDISNTGGGVLNFAGAPLSLSGGGGGPAINLVNNAGTTTLTGLGSVATSGAAAFGASNAGAVNLGTAGSLSATGGAGLDVSGTSLTATLTSVTSSGSPGQGINLTNVTGAVTINGGSVSGASGTAFNVSGGGAPVTYAGSVASTASRVAAVSGRGAGNVTLSGNLSGTGSSTGILVQNNTGGTFTFSGGTKTLNTAANTAVTLATNSGATVRFQGGGLDIDTTSGAGLSATGGGTVEVSGAGNSITSGSGTALNVASTTIAAAGLVFQSIAANGGTSGIVLNNTGALGGLTVTGTGAAGSGGTIQNTTGDGISLTSTSNVSLTSMDIAGSDGNGIFGSLVTGLSLDSCRITGNTDALNEAGLHLLNLRGTNTVANSEVSGSTEDNIRLVNDSGVLPMLSISNCDVRNNSNASGNVGINIQANQTAQMTVSAQGNRLNGNRTIALRADAADTSQLTVTLAGNTITAGTAGNPQGNQGIEVSSALSSQVSFDIDNNTVSGLGNTGINVFAGNTSTVAGFVQNNQVTNAGAGVSGFGIRVFQSLNSHLRANVRGNTVSNVGLDYGILAEASGGSSPGAGQALLEVAVTGNNASVLSGALDAIRVQSRNVNTACARISGNTTNSGGSGFFGLFVRQANTAVFNLEGLAAGAQTAATTRTFLIGQNPAAATVDAIAVTNFTGVPANSCNIP